MVRIPTALIIVLVLLILLMGMIDNMFFGPSRQAGVPPLPTTAWQQGLSNAGQLAPANQVPPGLTGPTVGPFPGQLAGPPAAYPTAGGQAVVDAVAATRAELMEAANLTAEAELHTDQALRWLTSWDEDIEPLRDSDDGRVVAAHADLAEQMAHLLSEERPDRRELGAARDKVQSLRAEVGRLATAVTPTRLAPTKIKEIRELHQVALHALEQWTKAVGRANAIVREARRRPPPTPATAPNSVPSPEARSVVNATGTSASLSGNPVPAPTLTSAEDELPSELKPPKPESLGAAVQRIEDQKDLEEIQKEIARKKEREEEIEKERQKKESTLRKREAQQAELREEARSQEVLQALQPFLVRRYVQPRLAGASLQMRRTFDEQPMSLGAINGVGALEENVNGLSMLARLGSHRELGPPRWEYNSSPRTWSKETANKLKEAQDLLRRLGPALVEEKLLSP